jgi:hypothetical protein
VADGADHFGGGRDREAEHKYGLLIPATVEVNPCAAKVGPVHLRNLGLNRGPCAGAARRVRYC